MAGSSIAAPSAAPWVTDFLNAAYFARADEERDLDDLRLAQCILATRWALHAPRRLGARNLPAFHRAFGAARLRQEGRLDRESLLAGGGELVGDWFPDAYADSRRRAHGVAFASIAARREFDPALRQRHSALGPLTPPTCPEGEREWETYDPVALPDPDAALAFVRDPARWPDFGSELGRFTAVRAGGLDGQTFEIEINVQPMPRLPIFTRGYVTCTEVHRAGRSLERRVAELAVHIDVLPADASPLALVVLTTHHGHFLGRALSHLLVFESAGRAFIRDVGCWDPLPWHLRKGYEHGGQDAQVAFWGPQPPRRSMLAQLAVVSTAQGSAS